MFTAQDLVYMASYGLTMMKTFLQASDFMYFAIDARSLPSNTSVGPSNGVEISFPMLFQGPGAADLGDLLSDKLVRNGSLRRESVRVKACRRNGVSGSFRGRDYRTI